MTPGAILLWLSLAFGVSALAASWRWPQAARMLSRAHAGAVLGALALLLVAFLTSDLSYAYVWAHTRLDAPLAYKLAGVWGGEDGTILLWNGVVALSLLLVQRTKGDIHKRAALTLLVFSLALTLVQLASGAFATTDALSLATHPRGRGLAEVLETPLMVIHPPIQFVGYALMSVPAAYAIALFTGPPAEERAWITPAYKWARVAWLFATIGLGLGALWAYYVLSFGGYWAWDPVETSNLLPWLALTAFLHAGKHHEKFGDHPLTATLLALTAALFTLFATFATRSGLWVSVHAFTDPTGNFKPDAAARLLGIIAVHAPSRAFLALLTTALFASIALFARHHAWRVRAGWARAYLRAHVVLSFALAGVAALAPGALWSWLFGAAALAPSMALGLALVFAALVALPLLTVYLEQEEHAAKRKLDARLVMSVAIALFVIATAVAFLVNLQVINGPDRSIFDVRAPYIVLPMVSTLTVMLGIAPLGKRGALLLAGAGALSGLVAWSLFPAARTLALSAPFLVAATVATALKLAHVQGKPASPRLRVAGVLLLCASVLGLIESSNPLTYVAGLTIPTDISVASGFVGVALATLGLFGAVAAFRARGHALALAGGAGAALSVGYGVGALLALVALALVWRERSRFSAARWPEGARLRETGIYVVHLAVILSLLGYAASTYSGARGTFAAVPVGSSVHVGSYDISVGAAQETTAASGLVDAVRVPIAFSGAGSSSLDFAWHETHYSPRLEVRRALTEDVYVSPLAFHTTQGWVGATAAASDRIPPGAIDAVTFSVSVLPLMSLVWTGLSMGSIGMGMILAGARLHARAAPSDKLQAADLPASA